MKVTILAGFLACTLLGVACSVGPIQAAAESNHPLSQYKYGLQLIADEEFELGREFILKSMQAGNKEAIAFWDVYEGWVDTLIKAKAGDMGSQREVGYNYSLDNSPVATINDPEQTLKWLSAASDQGDYNSSFLLGQLYSEGRVFHKNESTAFDWFYRSAKQGSAEGKYELFKRLIAGKGVSKDASKAEMWLRLAANSGHPEARASLLDYYYFQGTNQNLGWAAHWLAIEGDKSKTASVLPYLTKLSIVARNPTVFSSFDSDKIVGHIKPKSDLYALYFEGEWVEVYSPKQNLLGVMKASDVSVQKEGRTWALKNNYQLCKVECDSSMCYQTNADGTTDSFSYDADKAALCHTY
ncbi:hypothetical protein GCM10011607_12290 [Shewanella inventionis]|uniref:Sel1 repeat family protein n=1 Tax=Shewanella inventionis TaxID=1738770 RepID=A0ABQ1IV69_9GAMM|nr:tetratricopeptide repeat protein [Shewanella inventionis]GGB53291.1 hypothetical protein GCM10011607_12290 [Shewanella inventionis]